MQFTDSHCHLDFAEFDTDRTQLLAACAKQGIHRIIVPSIGAQNFEQVLNLCQQSQKKNQALQCFAALGIHPWYVAHAQNQTSALLETMVQQHLAHIVAIGETGLDGAKAKHESTGELQLRLFKAQIALANELELPLIVHHRQSHNEILQTFKQIKPKFGGILHAFSGSYQQAMQYIERGFKLGIGGTISYQRAKKTRNAIKRLPLESLVLETDAPAMPLEGFQGQANSPLMLIKVFDCLSQLLELAPELLAEQLEKNIVSALPNLRCFSRFS